MPGQLGAPPPVRVDGVDGEAGLQRPGQGAELDAHAFDQLAQLLDQAAVVAAHGRGCAAQRAAVLGPGQHGARVGDRDQCPVVSRGAAQHTVGVESERREPQCHVGPRGQGGVDLLEHPVERLGHPSVPDGRPDGAYRGDQLRRRMLLRRADQLVQQGLGRQGLRGRRGDGDGGQQPVEQVGQPRLVAHQRHPGGAAEHGDLPVGVGAVRLVGDPARLDRLRTLGGRLQRAPGEGGVRGDVRDPAPQVRQRRRRTVPVALRGLGQQRQLVRGEPRDETGLVDRDGAAAAAEPFPDLPQRPVARQRRHREQRVRLAQVVLLQPERDQGTGLPLPGRAAAPCSAAATPPRARGPPRRVPPAGRPGRRTSRGTPRACSARAAPAPPPRPRTGPGSSSASRWHPPGRPAGGGCPAARRRAAAAPRTGRRSRTPGRSARASGGSRGPSRTPLDVVVDHVRIVAAPTDSRSVRFRARRIARRRYCGPQPPHGGGPVIPAGRCPPARSPCNGRTSPASRGPPCRCAPRARRGRPRPGAWRRPGRRRS